MAQRQGLFSPHYFTSTATAQQYSTIFSAYYSPLMFGVPPIENVNIIEPNQVDESRR